jgi:hypothetical protein
MLSIFRRCSAKSDSAYMTEASTYPAPSWRRLFVGSIARHDRPS